MIERWSVASNKAGMPAEMLTRLGHLVRRHPWWRTRASLVRRLLRRHGCPAAGRVLDAGCGWGVTLRTLEAAGYRVIGLDSCRDILNQLDVERPGRRLVEADLCQALPRAEEGTFDAVLALDVLEHLDDDRAAVRRLTRLLRPGGLLIVSVPAGPALWSEFDEIQGHRRRYVVETLNEAVICDDLQIERIAHWGRCLLPMARIQRSRSLARSRDSTWETYREYLKLPPWPVPQLMGFALHLDSVATIQGWRGRGTSLIAVARRSPNLAIADLGSGA